MDIPCVYQVINLPGIGNRYCCYLKAANIQQKGEVKSFIGNHQPGHSNQTVEGLYVVYRPLHFLPTGISKIFPNLLGIQIQNAGLKEISAESLTDLKHLESLDLQNNELTSLPDNLFVHTRKLKWIDFSGNKLEAMSSRVLKPLIEGQLEWINFGNNTKINICYLPGGSGINTVDELKKAINAAFGVNSLIKEEMAEFKESVWSGFKNLWQLQKFSDFSIVVEEKEFPVHKNVLAVQSSVFASMLETDDAVKTSNKLEIKDCSEDVVEKFLRALYTGEIENENEEKQRALDLFSLASTFDVPKLKAVTEIQVVEELNERNAVKALTLGNLYNSDVIIDAAFDMIKGTYPDVKIAEALKMKPERVEEIVKTIKGFKDAMESLNSI